MTQLATQDRAEIVPAQQQDDYAFLDRTEGDAPTREVRGQEDPKDGHLHGFVYGMSYEDYDHVDALNGSKIVNMRRSPLYYKHVRENPKPATVATTIGSVLHRLVLEPNAAENISVWGHEDWMKTRHGQWWENWKKNQGDNTILTVKENEAATRMAVCALSSAPIMRYANADGPTEVCIFWRDLRTGKRMKARLDKVLEEDHIIPDLKSTRDSRPWKFGNDAYRLGYVVKMAHYWDGYLTLKGVKPSMKLLAIENIQPHESIVYNLPHNLIMIGLEERDALVDKIIECETRNRWPALETEEIDLTMPPWASPEEDAELSLEL